MNTTLEKKRKEDLPSKEKIVNTNKSLHNIYQTEDATFLEISLPGYDKKDIEIKFSKNSLTVKNLSEKTTSQIEDAKYLSRGFERASFSDTFIIPEDIDVENISAKMEAGILFLTFPIKEEININKIIKIK